MSDKHVEHKHSNYSVEKKSARLVEPNKISGSSNKNDSSKTSNGGKK
ncbi:hypothetical protein [Paenibacillus sp. FSL K6-1230]